MAYLSAEYLATGEIPKRTGNNHPIASPYGLFRARDGRVAVAPSNDVFVERFLQVLNLGYLLDEERFKTNADRMENRDELLEIINKVTEKNYDKYKEMIMENIKKKKTPARFCCKKKSEFEMEFRLLVLLHIIVVAALCVVKYIKENIKKNKKSIARI